MGSESRHHQIEGGHQEPLKFDEVARRLQLYLIAMWGRVFPIRGQDPEGEQVHQQPAIHGETLHFPQGLAPVAGISSMASYRAAAMHMAAHVAYSPKFDTQDLKPRQRLLVELVEDARVEALAIKAFPGLRPLWLSQSFAAHPSADLFPDLIRTLSRTLLEGQRIHHDQYWVNKGLQLFLDRQGSLGDPEISLEIGLRLAHDLGQMRLDMNDHVPMQLATYRDDNRHLWQMTENVPGGDLALSDAMAMAARPEKMLEEAETGLSLPFTDGGLAAQHEREGLWVEEANDPPRLIYFRSPQSEREAPAVCYPEWFDSIGLERSEWCTVRVQSAPMSASEIPAQILAQHQPWLNRQRRDMDLRRLRRLRRAQRHEDGENLDIDAVVHAQVERRAGDVPDPRIYESRQMKPDTGMCLSLLLDLSESVSATADKASHSMLDLARQMILLMGESVKGLDYPLAVGGFRSNGRHEVDYVRVKAFEDPFDADVQARLYGLTGGGSTRMGAAIRHACSALAAQAREHRTLFIVTDGEPSDIDVFDADHLIQDARYAVRQARYRGIRIFCVCLDATAQPAVARIFGAAHYLVLDSLESLPQRLTRLFMKLDQVL